MAAEVRLETHSPPHESSTSRSDSSKQSQPAGVNSAENMEKDVLTAPLERTPTRAKELWKFRLRPADDDEPQDWWFASTAIPLLAATIGPLANVMSIAALVTSWRNIYDPAYPGQEPYSYGFPDPNWCIALNAASLVCGFVGNIFLMFNFTRRIRYIIALPMTIILWYFATGILISITICMNIYVPPNPHNELYSQGFWHAVIAATLYLISSMLLMVNMQGYFFGHYPQHFELTEDQRNLILQSMMFVIWLAGGAGVFAATQETWTYVDALYFCDVTVLTVGFGDYYATNDVGRGLVFPFSVGGIIILGLMVSSIQRFAKELSHDKIIKKRVESRRIATVSRSVTTSFEAERRNEHLEKELRQGKQPTISAPFNPQKRTIAFDDESRQRGEAGGIIIHNDDAEDQKANGDLRRASSTISSMPKKVIRAKPLSRGVRKLKRAATRKTKLLILREEKDRFNAMRGIQYSTKRFKKYSALCMSIIAFSLLWCVGAVVFWKAERHTQNLSYFQALYFCYVSLLTIGYGDLSPKSNAGKPFFIVWSLIAVPTMTILISDMSDTIIASYKRGTFTLADWTVLPKQGFFRLFLERHPTLLNALKRRVREKEEKQRIENGFALGPADDGPTGTTTRGPTLDELCDQDTMNEHAAARRLTRAIRNIADDMKSGEERRYPYEQWVEYTRLIRFSRTAQAEAEGEKEEEEEEELGIVEWDWIGENSPMLAEHSESEWILDRLIESLDRYIRKQLPRVGRRESGEEDGGLESGPAVDEGEGGTVESRRERGG